MTNELIDFTLVSVAMLGIGIYGLAVKRNFMVEAVMPVPITVLKSGATLVKSTSGAMPPDALRQ